MAKLTPAEMAEKWARNLSGATVDIRRGVERVTESPTEKAAAAQEKMLQRLTDRVNDGTWAARLRGVSLQEWKDKMLVVGVGRITAGVQAAAPKMTAFASELLSFEDTLKARIDGMPDVTLEDSIARATAWIRGMSEFRRT